MKTLVLLLLALAQPARADWQPPSRSETALFVAAEALIVVDVLQTRDLLRHADPARHPYEQDFLLGAHPGNARLFATGGAAMLVTAAAWYFFPTPWRDCVTLSVIGVEVPNTVHSAMLGARISF